MVVFAARGTTRRAELETFVAVVVGVADRAVDVWGRATTRRGAESRSVLTMTSIGLLVIETVVPGFNSVRILFDK